MRASILRQLLAVGLSYCDGAIENNTVTQNFSISWGGTAYCHGMISNCIIWGNSIEDILWWYAKLSFSCIEGCDGGCDGNISADSLFADPNNNDYHLKSQAGRWDPKSKTWVKDDVTSPCIDAGDPNTPIGQEPLPNGGRIDMGAYSGTAYASMSEIVWLAGDINHDDIVNVLDFAILAENWLEDNRAGADMNDGP